MKALTFFWTQFVVIPSQPLISQVGSWERPEIHTSNMLSFVGRSSWQICIPSLAVKEMIPTTGVTKFSCAEGSSLQKHKASGADDGGFW